MKSGLDPGLVVEIITNTYLQKPQFVIEVRATGLYPQLTGTLTYLSADTLVDDGDAGAVPYYRAQVTTAGSRFSKQDRPGLEILPGMTATVEIRTGKSTVFDYLAKPVVKTVSESFSDR